MRSSNDPKQSPPVVLSVAGSDSGAGAGIQADLKTASALGAYAVTVITAVTAQNTNGVSHVEPMSPASVEAQLESVLADFPVAAVKIGLVPGRAIAEVVGAVLKVRDRIPVVLDPVGSASAGGAMADETARDALIHVLFPLTTLLMPNVNETFALSGLLTGTEASEQSPADEEAALIAAGRKLLALGPSHVLLKGGHRSGAQAVDLLLSGGSEPQRFSGPRLRVRNDHGTGCTLSTAITVELARGNSMVQAVARAKRYVAGALAGADTLDLGAGAGPLDHFFERSIRSET